MPTESVTAGNGRVQGARLAPGAADSANYRWIALSTVTLGTLMVFINQSIVLISLPDIFRGIGLNPLTPGNTGYMLWMLMGFMVVLAVLVVTLGRVGDMFGRVKIFNLGFAVFTAFSAPSRRRPGSPGTAGAIWLIAMRIGQGVGGAMLFANSSAIITDAFPADQRGLGLGINNIAAIAGSFVGLVLGGLLAPVEWHLVFLISVPFGILGTLVGLREARGPRDAHPGQDRLARQHHLRRRARSSSWSASPTACCPTAATPWAGPAPWCWRRSSAASPSWSSSGSSRPRWPSRCSASPLFRIRAFTAGNVASFLASLSRGGLMFMLIIWLQGIWLPLHGYSFAQTPLWAGHLHDPADGRACWPPAPLSGMLADRYGARPFATGGLVLAALTFILLITLPVNFSYAGFAALIFFNSVGHGHVHRAEPDRHHEQPAGQPARRRRRHGGHLQRVGPGALHRDLLHPDDPGAGLDPARPPCTTASSRRASARRWRRRVSHLPPVGQPLRRLPRLQPDAGPARARRAVAPAARHRGAT